MYENGQRIKLGDRAKIRRWQIINKQVKVRTWCIFLGISWVIMWFIAAIDMDEYLAYNQFMQIHYSKRSISHLELPLEYSGRTRSLSWPLMTLLLVLQCSSNFGIGYERYIFHCLLWGRISIKCFAVGPRNDRNCKCVFVHPQNN